MKTNLVIEVKFDLESLWFKQLQKVCADFFNISFFIVYNRMKPLDTNHERVGSNVVIRSPEPKAHSLVSL